jgi:hypothetical protein
VSAVHVIPVRNRSEMRRFIRLPGRLYAADPNFVPPLYLERHDALSRGKNPYFEHAEAQYFLAVSDGVDVGRISAQIDQLVQSPLVGHFGLLAARDDADVFAALFGAAEAWLRSRGRTRVQGPFSLSINEETGLLIDGFDSPPMIFMAHNPRCAAAHVAAQGYLKAKDLIAYIMDLTVPLPARVQRVMGRLESAGLRVRHLDMSRYESEFKLVMEIFNDAWSQNWGFVPFTQAELNHMAKGLKPLLDPRLTAVVECNGEPVAFGILLPNLNAAIRDFGGRLLPFNWLKLLWRLKRGIRSGRVPLMGVRRSFQAGMVTGMVPFQVIDALHKGAAANRIEQVELSWILEDNRPMRRILEELGGVPYKTYRVFEKQLT